MAGNLWLFLIFLSSVILGVHTKSVSDQLQDQSQNQTKPPGQRICFHVSDPNANDLSAIFSKEDKSLYNRQHRPLPDCSNVSGIVELDTCSVCVRAEQVRAECNVTDPSVALDFEASSKNMRLNETKIQCESTTTTTTPTTTPAIQTKKTTAPPPYGLSARDIALITVGIIVGLVITVGVAVSRTARIRSWCSHTPVPTEDRETRTEMTQRPVTANGHGPPNP